MFAPKKIFAGLFVLLFIMLTLSAFNARAALPNAGITIGTKAKVSFDIGDVNETIESNAVETTIANVYATKISAVGEVQARVAAEADVRFTVRNIGNGNDDVTLSVSKFPDGVDTIALFRADGNGVADEASRVDFKQGGQPLVLTGVARDDVKNIVARIAVPAGTTGKLTFEIAAANKGSEIDSAEGAVEIVDDKDFVVEAGENVVLENQQALLKFNVRSGTVADPGYFELLLKNKSDGKAVKYTVVKEQIVFDNQNVAKKNIEAGDTKTAFKIDAMPTGVATDFKLKIEIPEAKLGDEFVMVVNYGKADTASIAVGPSVTLKSTSLEITSAHEVKAPTLAVMGNSAGATPFSTITEAVSGDTVEYTVRLTNESTAPENFSLELSNTATLIRGMEIVDKNGNAFNAASGTGLPETGLIDGKQSIEFKVKVALNHGVVADSDDVQALKLTAKSLTEPLTKAVEQNFSIARTLAVSTPTVKFYSDAEAKNSVTALDVSGRTDIAEFYMKVEMPQKGSMQRRDYHIAFDLPGVTMQTIVGDVEGSAMNAMNIALGHGDKAGFFLVKADMRGVSMLEPKVTVIDVMTKLPQTGAIKLTKQTAVGFAEPGYSGNGTPDLDTVLTVNVTNHGGAIVAGAYEIYADVQNAWKFAFSIDGKKWQDSLALLEMDSLQTLPVQVKITVPRDVKAGVIDSLKIALRKKGGATAEATTVITLTIGKSKLQVSKTVGVVKKGNINDAPSAFVEKSVERVESGDHIHYKVIVHNPIDAPTAKNIVITDPLPPHVVFGKINGLGLGSHQGGNVTMKIDEIKPGESKKLEYAVTVDLDR